MDFLVTAGFGLLKDGYTLVASGLSLKAVVADHIDGARVKFDKILIKDLKNDGFNLDLEASLSNTGSIPATITFHGLNVMWSGSQIATLKLFNRVSTSKEGTGKLTTGGTLTITNEPKFTDFLGDVLQKKSFDWTIESPNLGVSAAIILDFDSIDFRKEITVKAFDGLRKISLKTFRLLPGDVVDGKPSITIEAKAEVDSPSDLSISVGEVRFKFSLGDRFIGRFSADKLDLPANDVKPFNFCGYIIEPDLGAVGRLMSTYLNGDPQTLKIQAESVIPDVAWIRKALVKHALAVSLPGKKHEVITSIELSNVAITNGPQHVSSGRIRIGYQNPFEFPIEVIKVSAAVELKYRGKVAAKFTLVENGVDSGSRSWCGNPGEIQISYEKQVLEVLEKDTFEAWRIAPSLSMKDVKLSGRATVVVKTAIGEVIITGLPFSDLSSGLRDIKWL